MVEKKTAFDTVNQILLIIIAILCIYPFVYILGVSLSNGKYIANGEITLFPKGLNLEAYKYILSDKNLFIFKGLVNSTKYTVIGTIVSVGITYMTAYVLSRRQFTGRFVITACFIFTWVFEAGIIPAYIVLSKLGFVDNWLVMVIPNAINVQYLLITKAFLDSMPYEMEEAAVIDGANDFQIMMKVYLPVSQSIIVTVSIFYAVFIWNQYLIPLIYLQLPALHTIQQVLKSLVISSGGTTTSFRTIIQNGIMLNPSNLKAAAIFIAMLPIVLIYPFVQKYFRKGILIGSVKG
jgi:putative aldouronate transport system permease protein